MIPLFCSSSMPAPQDAFANSISRRLPSYYVSTPPHSHKYPLLSPPRSPSAPRRPLLLCVASSHQPPCRGSRPQSPACASAPCGTRRSSSTRWRSDSSRWSSTVSPTRSVSLSVRAASTSGRSAVRTPSKPPARRSRDSRRVAVGVLLVPGMYVRSSLPLVCDRRRVFQNFLIYYEKDSPSRSSILHRNNVRT